MAVDPEFVLEQFTDQLEFGPCVVGKDIDLTAIRGFGRLDELAVFSSPDVYSAESNPTGTQRELKPAHVREAFEYATKTSTVGVTSVRAFPEILLNVREMLSVRVLSWESGAELDFDSHSALETIPDHVVKLVVDLKELDFPLSDEGPDISRVDGNHRLAGVDEYLAKKATTEDGEEDGDKLPDIDFVSVPFMVFLGLTIEEELKLFNDLNDKHEGMESSLLVDQDTRLIKPEEMKSNMKLRPRWIASELCRKGRAFDGIVHRGGRREKGKRINLSSLASAVATMQRNSRVLEDVLDDKPDAALSIVDAYWKAVAEVFDVAWQDRKNYILLQSIGLNGFAEYGADIVDEAQGKTTQEHFVDVLSGVKDKVDLDRHAEIWRGKAGRGGATAVAKELRSKADEKALLKQQILKVVGVGEEPTPDEMAAKLKEEIAGTSEVDEPEGGAAESSEQPGEPA